MQHMKPNIIQLLSSPLSIFILFLGSFNGLNDFTSFSDDPRLSHLLVSSKSVNFRSNWSTVQIVELLSTLVWVREILNKIFSDVLVSFFVYDNVALVAILSLSFNLLLKRNIVKSIRGNSSNQIYIL